MRGGCWRFFIAILLVIEGRFPMKTLTTALLLSLTVSAFGYAQTISLSFGGDAAGGQANNLLDGDVAGVVAVGNWNTDSTGQVGSLTDLMDSSGAATTADVEWSGPNNTWGGTADAATTADERMVNGWLDDNGTGAQINVTEIPYSVYDLYVYGSSDSGNAGRGFNVKVNDVAYFSGGEFTDLSDGGSFFSSAAGFVDASTTDPNPTYFKISGLSGDLSIFGLRDADGPALPGGLTDYRAGISGFQINAVPEPASFGMAAFALLGLLNMRRRNR